MRINSYAPIPTFPATQNVNLTEVNGTLQTAADWTGYFKNLDTKLSTLIANPLPVSLASLPGSPYDVSDRAARLVGIVYGNLGQLDQRSVSGRNLATVELDAVQSAAVTGVTGLGRLQPWYQPNSNVVNEIYSAGSIAPHANTTRWTYTVPANRIAIVQSAYCQLRRDSATATFGDAFASIRINDPTDMTTLMQLMRIDDYQGAQNAGQILVLGTCAILTAGQKLEGRDGDGSTGGTYTYIESANILEFDT